ncbi:hypothetical protein I316_03080 [Kwoniella heveanensis BCC8398]|uniref:Uncharacterized protein n=1 Tax=Kwoniella heveanensis BCC8398 TaxID=1296120 RepID=A0A1B9GVI3_9TREE|nr:hypothetical protein I316_03080 [Kwoniella heveanensis BCC8398]
MLMNSSSSSRGKFPGGSTGGAPAGGLSDSESSLSPSPSGKDRSSCFCGRPTLDGGIYCSVSCARSDAFSSLCYKPTSQPTFEAGPSSYPYSSSFHHSALAGAGAISSASLSRNPSSASATSIATASSGQDDADVGEWNASHYRRLARADIRREERREERRRRRAEGSLASSISTSRSTVMSTSSSASRAVPDLVGGGGASHSRNPSIASSITSMSSSTWGAGSSLSRNASSASTASRRGYGNNFNLENVIHEDDDEEEWLQSEMSAPYVPAMQMPIPMPVSTISAKKSHHKRGDSRSNTSNPSSTRKGGRKPTPDPLPFGMGKDMRDVLEEIIQMEKSFLVSDNDNDNDENDDDESMAPPPAGLFTSQFDRPPRTPSPVSSGKRRASIAPGAPTRGHRTALSYSAVQHAASVLNQPPPVVTAPQRPPSLMGLHQSSLSESHTALYLATASPVSQGRRSASPQLETRRSISFNAEIAGPSLSLDGMGGLSAPRRPFDSPSGNITPMGRRRLNHTPQAVHPSMDGWRFPSPMHGSNSTMATPTRPSASQVPSHSHADLDEPEVSSDSEFAIGTAAAIEPALLWPAPPNLQPSLFPSSPAIDTPDFQPPRRALGALKRSESGNTIVGSAGAGATEPVSAPGSGLRLGVLLGSGNDEDQEHAEMDVDMDEDVDGESSTEHDHVNAHGFGYAHNGQGPVHAQGYGHGHMRNGRTGYLPVFLEAEGFRARDGSRWG